MERSELSFHEYVKLLGFVCIDVYSMIGDILEIGVWKGKSLSFMRRLSSVETDVIGIDPFALPGQENEVEYFQKKLYSDCVIIKNYSQSAVSEVIKVSNCFKILHIDGGHAKELVWSDFLLYERFVIPGGYIIFDDYGDLVSCPDVGPAVDSMRNAGLFEGYDVYGQLEGYENSYVLRKR